MAETVGSSIRFGLLWCKSLCIAVLPTLAVAQSAPIDSNKMIQHLMITYAGPNLTIPKELHGLYWDSARAISSVHYRRVQADLERKAALIPDSLEPAHAYSRLRAYLVAEFSRWTGDYRSHSYRDRLAQAMSADNICSHSLPDHRILVRRLHTWAGLPETDWRMGLSLEADLLERWGKSRSEFDAARTELASVPNPTLRVAPPMPSRPSIEGFKPDIQSVVSDSYRNRCENGRRKFLEAIASGSTPAQAAIGLIFRTAADAVDVMGITRSEALIPNDPTDPPKAAKHFELSGEVHVAVKLGVDRVAVGARVERRNLGIPGAAQSDVEAFETLLDFASIQQARRAIEAAVAKGRPLLPNSEVAIPIRWQFE